MGTSFALAGLFAYHLLALSRPISRVGRGRTQARNAYEAGSHDDRSHVHLQECWRHTLLTSVSTLQTPCCADSLLTDAAEPLPVECAVAACVPDELLHGGYDAFRQTGVINNSLSSRAAEAVD